MAGRLRHLVTIQRQATTQDALGQRDLTWTDVDDVWAKIAPVSGRDFFNASGEHAEITHKVLMRHGVDVIAGDRILFGSRIFDVRVPINMGERDRFVELMVVEQNG